ncbi:hypothetical protein [Rhodoferax sp.]|uniref:hypothetical protein n=1 Tax=Rhodoferax sp. TaxID=50421 RepID=UPI00271FBF29|nr:hypothetical protein [Rhodoferax sp.]MDO8320905.1 hypothetical protein [Rhodoferax sp.]
MQFDFFNDNQAVVLRNDVIFALEKFDAPAAQQACETLTRHDPYDVAAVPLLLLIVTLFESTTIPFQSHTDMRAACLELQRKITPAAIAGMGPAAANAWLNTRWQALAARAVALPYHTGHPDEHAAPLWLQARQWQAAADAVAQIASWRRIPAPLSWMLHARLQLQGLQANWGLLAELAWLAPQRLENVVQQAAEPILQALARKFEEGFEGAGDTDDLVWFPAWVLTDRPTLAPALTQAQASQHTQPEQAMRVMIELLGLERQGRQRDVLAHRKTLRGLNDALYAAYMATR